MEQLKVVRAALALFIFQSKQDGDIVKSNVFITHSLAVCLLFFCCKAEVDGTILERWKAVGEIESNDRRLILKGRTKCKNATQQSATTRSVHGMRFA
jgi:hypothetical protein